MRRAGAPKQDIVENAPSRTASVLYEASARQGPIHPGVARSAGELDLETSGSNIAAIFTRGPLKSLCATLRVVPEGAGDDPPTFTVEVEAAKLAG